jgi:hypothetical protein
VGGLARTIAVVWLVLLTACASSVPTHARIPRENKLYIDSLGGVAVNLTPYDGAKPVSVPCGTSVSFRPGRAQWHVVVRDAVSNETLLDVVLSTNTEQLVIISDHKAIVRKPGGSAGGPPAPCSH